jgi:hypothetical protein
MLGSGVASTSSGSITGASYLARPLAALDLDVSLTPRRPREQE